MNELTPKESYQASLYKDPAGLFRRALIRKLTFIIPSLALMIYWYITRDPVYAIFGYTILLYQTIRSLLLAKRGIQTTNQIITKYETKGRS